METGWNGMVEDSLKLKLIGPQTLINWQLAIGNWQLAIGRTHVILFLFDFVFEIKVNDLKLMLVGPS